MQPAVHSGLSASSITAVEGASERGYPPSAYQWCIWDLQAERRQGTSNIWQAALFVGVYGWAGPVKLSLRLSSIKTQPQLRLTCWHPSRQHAPTNYISHFAPSNYSCWPWRNLMNNSTIIGNLLIFLIYIWDSKQKKNNSCCGLITVSSITNSVCLLRENKEKLHTRKSGQHSNSTWGSRERMTAKLVCDS